LTEQEEDDCEHLKFLAVRDITARGSSKTRGRPFQPGNPGRPKGARNRTTLAAEALLDNEGEALTRKAIELAMKGTPISSAT
jgi:hypothetical protein